VSGDGEVRIGWWCKGRAAPAVLQDNCARRPVARRAWQHVLCCTQAAEHAAAMNRDNSGKGKGKAGSGRNRCPCFCRAVAVSHRARHASSSSEQNKTAMVLRNRKQGNRVQEFAECKRKETKARKLKSKHRSKGTKHKRDRALPGLEFAEGTCRRNLQKEGLKQGLVLQKGKTLSARGVP
jgi:hypothetical protein